MFMSDSIAENPDVTRDHEVAWTQAGIVQALMWGIGGTLDHNSIKLFDEFFSSLWIGGIERFPVPTLPVGAVDVLLPSEGSVIRDHFYTFKGRGVWKHWMDVLKSEKLIETRFLSQMVVPTIDTLKYASLFTRHVHHRKQFLVCGEPAAGKTICVRNLLRNGPRCSSYLSNFITFTQKTTSAEAQELIVSRLNKKKRGHYGPPDGKFCVTFVDDVNAPAEIEAGAQPALELLRQFFDHRHWYDLEEPDKVFIQDTMFVAAMTLRGGNRGQLPHPRFLRHFNVYSISSLSRDSLFRIFTNVCLSGLKRNGFNADVLGMIQNLVNATLEVWTGALTRLKPTPDKIHYLFNVRDISKMVAGCVLIRKESTDSKVIFVKLWVHEILRVFGDRLIDEDDSNWLFSKLKECVKVFFKDHSFEAMFDHLPKYGDEINVKSLNDLIFGNFMDGEGTVENRRYEEIPNIDNLRKRIVQYLAEYNKSNAKKMDLLPFRCALEQLARLCRILRIPGESLIYVAVDGSGRRSLTRLAGHVMRQVVHEPAAGIFRDSRTWRANLSKALKSSAGSGEDFVFLITDRQMKDEHLLDVDSLLNSGEVSNLFTADERQEIIETVRLPAQDGDRNLEISGVAVMEYFVNRCRERLHFVLCFSPVGTAFRRALLSYPSLRKCAVNWFSGWPETALEEVATKYTKSVKVRFRCLH